MKQVKHYAAHVDWLVIFAVWGLLTWGAWGNSSWWIAVLLGVILPVMVMSQGHIRYCVIPATEGRNE